MSGKQNTMLNNPESPREKLAWDCIVPSVAGTAEYRYKIYADTATEAREYFARVYQRAPHQFNVEACVGNHTHANC